MAMSVLLPEPEGPMSATNSPACTSRSMPRSACTALPLLPKTFVRPRVVMMEAACILVVLVVLLDLLAGHVLERDLLAGGEAGDDLDALQGGDPRLHRHRLEVVLPVLGQPDELAASVQGLLGLGQVLGGEAALQPVDDDAAVAPLQGLQRDR